MSVGRNNSNPKVQSPFGSQIKKIEIKNPYKTLNLSKDNSL